MSAGLLDQLAGYGAYHEDIQGSIEASDILEGVRTDSLPQGAVLGRSRSVPVGLLTAAAAAVAVLLLVGGAVLLSRWSFDDVDDPTVTQPITETTVQDTTVTTIAQESGPPTPQVLAPGSWSVAAITTASETDLNAIVGEVMTWEGVFEAATATDQDTWYELTGFATCPVDGSPACAEGVVVLVAEPWVNEVSLRLQSLFGAETVTAYELAVPYWQAYADAVTSKGAPHPSFDTASLGSEVPLSRPTQLDGDLEPLTAGGTISMAVELEVDGTVLQAAVSTIDEYPGSVDVSVTRTSSVSSGRSSTAYLDASDQSVVMANLTGFTELGDPLGPRRVYSLAGLPLDAAVVATQLSDGTPIWQRPIDGMVLIVDEPGSLPERFRPFYDQDGLPDLEEMAPANPFVVYDAAGNEIMRIEENGETGGDRELIITDHRVPPIVMGSGSAASPGSSFAAINIGHLEEGVPSRLWAADRIAATDEAVWVGSQEFVESAPMGALYRIDPTTSDITDRIPMAGGVADLLADGDVLWVLTGAGDLHRMDASSGQITGTVGIGCGVDDCFWNGRSDLLATEDALWLTSDSNYELGQRRIDPTTLATEVVANDDGRDDSGGMWLGEANGFLWSLRSHDGWILGLSPESGERVAYEMHTWARVDAHESRATLVGDDIWLSPCCSRKVVRFDTATREVSVVEVGGWHTAVAGGALWIAGDGHISRIDEEAGVLTDSHVVEGLDAVSMIVDHSGAIWVSDDEAIIRIDSRTRQISDVIEVESGGQLLAANGVIWVAGQDGAILRIDTD